VPPGWPWPALSEAPTCAEPTARTPRSRPRKQQLNAAVSNHARRRFVSARGHISATSSTVYFYRPAG
jgi:hypothetical protein